LHIFAIATHERHIQTEMLLPELQFGTIGVLLLERKQGATEEKTGSTLI
jgi:hypothetical protein